MVRDSDHQPDQLTDSAELAALMQRQHEEAERQRGAREEHDRRLRRQRLWLIGLVLVVVVMGIITVLFISHTL